MDLVNFGKSEIDDVITNKLFLLNDIKYKITYKFDYH